MARTLDCDHFHCLQCIAMATTSKSGSGGGGGDIRGNLKRFASREVKMMDPHCLAKELHGCDENYLLLDCRPILAFNSCHIIGNGGRCGRCVYICISICRFHYPQVSLLR